MTDISYKQLAEKFLERDNNAINDWNNSYHYNGSESERLWFLEGRVKDLCGVVIALLNKLEEKEETK